MTETTTEVKKLREDTASLRQQLYTAGKRNEALSKTLRTARDELGRIKEEARRLTEPPNNWGTLIALGENAVSADVIVGGRRMRVAVAPEVEPESLRAGADVLLSEGLVIIGTGEFPPVGSVVNVREFVDSQRILVGAPGDDEQVFTLAAGLVDSGLRVGDAVVVDTRTHYALQVVEKPEVSSLLLEEVPDITYSDIGGLADQIEQIKDAVELPFEHPELYTEHGLKPPKGILLYGPPGCGKTLIAKAVANSLADRTGKVRTSKTYFLNIKGPELLDKYVGETERQLRLIFARAREKASAGFPVVVFFDEMESLFRTRGTGKSSDVETTIVPQLLAEIDGVEGLDNVIVIGATNREDMIDPAILRPGRLDVKIKIERPDAEGAKDIFSKYLTSDLPLHPEDLEEHDGDRDATVEQMIEAVVERMYAESAENQFLEVTYQGGDKEVLYFKDFNSGAMIQNIVDRSKKAAVKDFLTTGIEGLRVGHLLDACLAEFKENEDLPNTTNPDDWAKISGKKGERIVYVRTLIGGKSGAAEPGRSIDTGSRTGQYL